MNQRTGLSGFARYRLLLMSAVVMAVAIMGYAGGVVAGGPDASVVPKEWGVRVVASYPHDPEAFTQGLLIEDGQLYEGTGLNGHSSIRRVDLATGKVEQIELLSSFFFGEGIAVLDGKLYELTWKNHVGYIYDLKSFKRLGDFRYEGEGWGLTENGKQLILSDGTPTIRFIDPHTFNVVRTIEVRAAGEPVSQLNELEYIDGEIWANIWYEDRIARISPKTGEVLGWIDLSQLYTGAARGSDDVLNGIAYDAVTHRIYVTGKDWPKLYQIEVVPK